jgi:hypothetical protein
MSLPREKKEGRNEMQVLQYFKTIIKALVRSQVGLVVQFPKMQSLAKSFAVAQFEEGDKLYHTRLPNLLLQVINKEVLLNHEGGTPATDHFSCSFQCYVFTS